MLSILDISAKENKLRFIFIFQPLQAFSDFIIDVPSPKLTTFKIFGTLLVLFVPFVRIEVVVVIGIIEVGVVIGAY